MDRNAATSASASSASTTSAIKIARENPLTHRWLDLKSMSHSERYRNTYNVALFHSFEDGQQRNMLEGRLKLDKDERYTIGFRASSGRFFNWGYAAFAGASRAANLRNATLHGTSNWNKTPAEIAEASAAKRADPAGAVISTDADNGWEFYLRELYLSATPVKTATFEFGSFGIERGYASEATTFDYDGYITGERVRVQWPKHLYFDQVGFTSAYLGSINQPSLFDRGSDFKNSNYLQVFADKQLNKRVGFSADYTWLAGTDTLRQAATVQVKEVKIFDKVRVEAYERLNAVVLQGGTFASGSGFAITAEKKATDRLGGDIGFSSIDSDYAVYGGHRYFRARGLSLNGDTVGMGKHPFMHATYQVTPVINAFGYYTHAVGGRVINQNQQTVIVGLTVDLKAIVNTTKRVL